MIVKESLDCCRSWSSAYLIWREGPPTVVGNEWLPRLLPCVLSGKRDSWWNRERCTKWLLSNCRHLSDIRTRESDFVIWWARRDLIERWIEGVVSTVLALSFYIYGCIVSFPVTWRESDVLRPSRADQSHKAIFVIALWACRYCPFTLTLCLLALTVSCQVKGPHP